MKWNNTKVTNSIDIANSFSKHFSSIYNSNHNHLSTPLSINSDTTAIHDAKEIHYKLNTFDCISIDQTKTAIDLLKPSNTAGSDNIPSILIKMCKNSIAYPLTHIFNASLKTSIFPVTWKMANIVPVHKSGSKSEIKNYRPIAILNACAKVFEIVMKPQLTSYIYPLITEFQHGFMPKRSTISNLISLTNDLCNSYNQRSQTDVIYLDFAKAFDKVNHQILINKLNKFDIPDYLVSLIKNYLHNRSYKVIINGYTSDSFITNLGVPQGSILGPILFLTFINDLPLKISHSKCLMFADDVKIYKEITNLSDCKKLNSDISKINDWCYTNKMQLNISKCNVVSYSNKVSTISFQYVIDKIPIYSSLSIKDLGIIFDNKLTFQLHFKHITRKAYQALGFVIHRGTEFNFTSTFTYLYKAIVRPVLDYGSTIWNPYLIKDITCIEKIQKKYIKFIKYKDKITNSTYDEMCQTLSLPLLTTRRKITDSLFIYNILNNNIDSSNLLSLININYHHYNCRSSNLFYLPNNVNNNIKFNSPIDRCCKNLNLYIDKERTIDIFNNLKLEFCKKLKQCID